MGAITFFALPFPVELPSQIGGFSVPVFIVIDVGLALIITLLVLFVARTILIGRHLRNIGREGRRVSRAARELVPLTSFRRNGVPGDPLNVRVVATEAQLGAAFANAGWYRADEITLITALRISIDSLLGRKYSTAPVSNLYLFGRRQDIAFEQPGRSVRERDHVRFWKTATSDKNQRPLWIGGATKDIRVALSPRTHMPTHLIEPDVDIEREFLVEDLSATGWVIHVDYSTGDSREVQRDNGDGGAYHTDGAIAELELANVAVLPIAAQVHGPIPAQLVKNVIAPVFRNRLPNSGRERAARVQEARAASSARLKKPDGS
jgi:LssY C-terminus